MVKLTIKTVQNKVSQRLRFTRRQMLLLTFSFVRRCSMLKRMRRKRSVYHRCIPWRLC